MTLTLDHWIGGASRQPTSGRYIDRLSPLDGRLVRRVADGSADDVDAAVESAAAARDAWRRTTPAARGRLLLELARLIRASAAALAEEEVAETGKLAGTAAGEVEGAAQYFEFYGEVINAAGGETIDLGPGYHSYTRHEPFGVVAVITPWNLPINQAARACAPAIAAGNTVVLKPSSMTSTTSIRLGELARAAGIPDGVFNVVLGGGSTVGPMLAGHDDVRKIVFTGSVEVGRSLAHLAADRLIPMTLELGGKGANVVFADADLDRAAEMAVAAFTANAGQVCSAGTRLIVERSVHDAMLRAVVERAAALEPGVTMCAQISDGQRRTVIEYLEIAEDEGAIPSAGGLRAAKASEGMYLPATVYSGVRNDMRIAQEEVFGPVLVVIPFDTAQEAIDLANDSPYGLVAGVWTRDVSRAIRVAEEIEAGQVFVNSWWAGGVQTPFGGFKLSGYGREKGVEALHHYTQTKCVTIAL